MTGNYAKYLLALGAFILCVCVNANNIRFEHLRVEEGSGGSKGRGIGATRSITQDKDGFMWFGGENGLAKYDGHTFRIYSHDPNDKTSLSNAFISDLLVDREGKLWVATHAGLNQYDPTTDEFKRFENEGALGELHGKGIVTMHEDENRRLYVVTSTDIRIFSADRKTYSLFHPSDKVADALHNNGIFSIYKDSKGILWVGTQGWGLLRYDETQDSLVHFVNHPDDDQSLSHDTIISIAEDRSGRLWFGTQGGGLCRLNKDGKSFTRYFDKANLAAKTGGKTVWKIFVDSRGKLWASIVGAGVAQYEEIEDRFTIYSHSKFDPYSVSSATLPDIFEDSNGDIWLGVFPSGVNFWNRSSAVVSSYYHHANDLTSISHSAILSFFQDSQGLLWVGTEEGLNLFDIEQNAFEQPFLDIDDEFNIRHSPILSIEEDQFNNLWFGTWASGLVQLNKKSGELRHYIPDENKTDGLKSEYIWQVLSDSQGRLWVATETHGLSLYNYENETFERVNTVASNRGQNQAEFAWPIFEDSRGRIWLSSERKVEVLDSGEQQFKLLDLLESELGITTRVMKFYEDSRGDMWFGTHDSGVIRFNQKNKALDLLTTDTGLPSNSIASIIEDKNGDIWVTTTNGISRINSYTLAVQNYNQSDGLVGGQSIRDASFVDESGRLYLGTTEGFNVFQPNALKYNDFVPPIVLTDFKIFNRSAQIGGDTSPLNRHINQTEAVTLDSDQSAFSIEFSALSYRSSYKNKYQYKLEGFDKEWNSLEGKNTATYANLEPGVYYFQVKGANNDGLWSKREPDLRIEVQPPFWATWWAYLSYFTLASLIIYLVFSAQVRRMALLRQRELNDELVRLDKLKSEFISNTSHELKTPLNGIIGIAELLRESGPQNIDPKILDSNLLTIVSSGKRLSNLVENIIDFSKLSSDEIKLDLGAVNLHGLANEIVESMHPHIGSKPITLESKVAPDTPSVLADEGRIKKTIENLVDNAIKFTESGEIKITTSVKTDFVTIAVTDSGIGIEDEHKDAIFCLFQQGDGSMTRNYGGMGLGLATASQIVKLHGGAFEVHSEDGEGASFQFDLPIYTEEHGLLHRKRAPKMKGMNISGGSRTDSIRNSQEERLDTLPNKIESKAEERKGIQKQKILAVDDDPVNLMVLGKILDSQNYSVREAVDGAQALDLMSSESFDLIILDVMMPNMSGFEVASAIRKTYTMEALPIIFLSASDREEDVAEGKQCGGNEYLTKPLSKEKLIGCLNHYLEEYD